MTNKMKQIVDFCQKRGFVYAGSDIYGGLANSWDYGPYGSILKENIKNLWIREMVQKRKDMMLQDSSILMNPKVWVASGHVGGFSDPLIDDKITKQRFRADKLLEEHIETIKDKESFMKKYEVENLIPESWTLEKQTQVMREEDIKNPKTGEKADWSDAKKFNLMYKTHQGVTEDSSTEIYLRPETAQGIFTNFSNVLRTSRRKLPFGVAQVGKAFRNEITPGNFIFRTREFEQMEIEYFVKPGEHKEAHKEWLDFCMKFLIETLGIKEENLRIREHEDDELSHYSDCTYDIEYKFPFGWGELWGIASRTDFDLKAHMTESKQDLSYLDPSTNEKYIPYVIEPSVGLNRLFLAVLCDSYENEEGQERLRMKTEVSPIKVGILPITKKLTEDAENVFNEISRYFQCEIDDAGKIGKRYARMDEIGVPVCISIDSNGISEGKATIRNSKTKEQEELFIDDLFNEINFIMKDIDM